MIELISKQAAINTTFNMCCRWDGEDRDDLRNMMLTAFQDLPTIDPAENGGCWGCQCALLGQAPVKHGKWIADKYTRKCSECKSTYWMREGNEWNYCPNCGSKNGGEG